MVIVNCIVEETGWSPIQHLVSLAARLFEADLLPADTRYPSLPTKLQALLKRRRSSHSGETCLFICQHPTDLARLLKIADWNKRFGNLAAWVIDSFWVNRIPAVIRVARPFNHFFVTSLEDVPAWKKITGVPTTWLPWGTDALRMGSADDAREWDVTRVGRQPAEWNDDEDVTRSADMHGIRYRGRVRSEGVGPLQNHEVMMRTYGSTKFIMAFSNAVNPELYTHPTRQYLTGRWVDALAGGAIVAGIAPRCPDAEQLLWKGATLELGSTRREEGLRVISGALRDWTPQRAADNHLQALERLDWRWRLQEIARKLSIDSTSLRADLDQLNAAIKSRKKAAG